MRCSAPHATRRKLSLGEQFVHEAAHYYLQNVSTYRSNERFRQIEGVGQKVRAEKADAVEITNRYRVRKGGNDAWQRLQYKSNPSRKAPTYYGKDD